MNSKEIGMFKALFPSLDAFAKADSSHLVEKSGGNKRNNEVPEVGWGHSIQVLLFFFSIESLRISRVKIKTRLFLKLIPYLTFNSSSITILNLFT